MGPYPNHHSRPWRISSAPPGRQGLHKQHTVVFLTQTTTILGSALRMERGFLGLPLPRGGGRGHVGHVSPCCLASHKGGTGFSTSRRKGTGAVRHIPGEMPRAGGGGEQGPQGPSPGWVPSASSRSHEQEAVVVASSHRQTV